MKQHLKQRLLGATVIVSLAVIFLPVIFDGDGYRQLSKVEIDVPERPRLSFEQNFPELPERSMVVTRGRIDASDPPVAGDWFVRVADFDAADAAESLVKRLSDRGYRAAYKSVVKGDDETFKVEVNVGADKTEAEDVAARIKQEYGFKTSLARR